MNLPTAIKSGFLTNPNSTALTITTTIPIALAAGFCIGKITQLTSECFTCIAACATYCCLAPCINCFALLGSIGLNAAITLVALPYIAPVSSFVQITFFIGTLIAHIPSRKQPQEERKLLT